MTEQDFISSCMSELQTEYPDPKQRYAVCKSKWDRRETKLANENEILIFPAGKYYVEKYDKWFDFNVDFFNQIIDTFTNSKLPKPFIDIDHEQGKSYGEITALFITPEGLKGKVELTDEGKTLLRNNAYRYVSPSWGEIIDNDGRKWLNYLNSVSLTNIPALVSTQQKLQDQLTLNRINNLLFQGGTEMKKLNFQLSQITDEAVRKLVEDLIAQGESQEDIIASLTAKVKELQAELEKAQAEKTQIETEMNKLKSDMLEKEAEEFVEKQLNAKKIEIAVADFWKEQYKLAKDKTIKYFEALSERRDDVGYKLSSKYNLSQEDIAVMKSVGLNLNDDKDIQLYLNANNK